MVDYIVNVDGEFNILIEEKKSDVRKDVIAQYVACRKEKGMTQEEIANILGVKRPNIARFENGNYNPTLDFMVKMAESMDMNLEIKLVNK